LKCIENIFLNFNFSKDIESYEMGTSVLKKKIYFLIFFRRHQQERKSKKKSHKMDGLINNYDSY